MNKEHSYTVEEVAGLLRVSKLTVYDIIKKGELPAFRVGRQMRIDQADLENYKRGNRQSAVVPSHNEKLQKVEKSSPRTVVISGQDMVLDLLASEIEKNSPLRPLRSYVGSLNSLISMYQGECDIVSLHLFDGETGEYNVPYVKKLLTGHSYTVVNLVSRMAGFYVPNGNPQNIQTWSDLSKPFIQLANREKGSGARVLLDEQLILHNISPNIISGYENEESNHLSVASAIASGRANVGIGIEKAARIVGIDFIPLIQERYDLVILKSSGELLNVVKQILRSDAFKKEVASIGGYDVSLTGEVIYETPF
ncbi:helix-turn-helix transcriptional regulator [Fictibacillus gelatini]|uniref:helix-turn-helix transcriptional regulator n=1 Tax=Fictibacillus gelatini TaxID=225985 RepID=UPI00042029AF|nr:helix-turn-helix transcriptional regulator [Fictibacillus gelatini]